MDDCAHPSRNPNPDVWNRNPAPAPKTFLPSGRPHAWEPSRHGDIVKTLTILSRSRTWRVSWAPVMPACVPSIPRIAGNGQQPPRRPALPPHHTAIRSLDRPPSVLTVPPVGRNDRSLLSRSRTDRSVAGGTEEPVAGGGRTGHKTDRQPHALNMSSNCSAPQFVLNTYRKAKRNFQPLIRPGCIPIFSTIEQVGSPFPS